MAHCAVLVARHSMALDTLVTASQIRTNGCVIAIVVVGIVRRLCRRAATAKLGGTLNILNLESAQCHQHCIGCLAHHECTQPALAPHPTILAQFIDFVNVANDGHFAEGHEDEENGDKEEQVKCL